jgi:hypothetical protein
MPYLETDLMRNLIRRAMLKEVDLNGKKRRAGRKVSVFGHRVPVHITLPKEIARKAHAMAKSRRLPLGRLIEKLLLNEERVFEKALIDMLGDDKNVLHSVGLRKIEQSSSVKSLEFQEPHTLVQNLNQDSLLPVPGSIVEPELCAETAYLLHPELRYPGLLIEDDE